MYKYISLIIDKFYILFHFIYYIKSLFEIIASLNNASTIFVFYFIYFLRISFFLFFTSDKICKKFRSLHKFYKEHKDFFSFHRAMISHSSFDYFTSYTLTYFWGNLLYQSVKKVIFIIFSIYVNLYLHSVNIIEIGY